MLHTVFNMLASLSLGLTAATLTPTLGCAATRNFNGVWSVQWCDKTNPERDCGGFTLDRAQDGDRLCGEHYVATVGLSRLDEGSPGSVLGSADGNTATIVINAARTGAHYHATAVFSDESLKLRIIGNLNTGESSEPTIIPQQAVLARDIWSAAVAHLEDMKTTMCLWSDE